MARLLAASPTWDESGTSRAFGDTPGFASSGMDSGIRVLVRIDCLRVLIVFYDIRGAFGTLFA